MATPSGKRAESTNVMMAERGERAASNSIGVTCERFSKSYLGPLLGIAFVAIHGFDILTYPLVTFDEAFLNDAGWQLTTAGHFRADVLSLNPGFESHYFWQPPALPLTAALAYRLLGFGLWQTRLPCLLFGGLSIWAIFALVRHLRPRGLAAVIASLSLFFWPAFVLTAKTSRMDTGAIFALLLATLWIVRALDHQEAAYKHAFAAGILTSLALMFHTAAAPWALSLLIVVFLFARRRIGTSAAYCCGTACLVVPWLLYAIQFPEEFSAQYLSHLAARATDEGVLERLLLQAARYRTELYRVPTFYVVLALGIFGYSIAASPGDRRSLALLVLTGLTAALTAFVVGGSPTGYYTTYPMALAFCAIAIGLEDAIFRNLEGGRYRTAAAIGLCVGAMVLNSLLVSVGPRLLAYWFQGQERDYALQTAPLAEQLKPGDQVWGPGTLWFAAVTAGARLQAFDVIPPHIWTKPDSFWTKPDPYRHRYVVVRRGELFPETENYVKLGEFGAALPVVLGSPLSDRSYTFDLWQSKEFPERNCPRRTATNTLTNWCRESESNR
jgi:4-amino-4-deoxy-L-arabinose transferase-like glycosyltransferase